MFLSISNYLCPPTFSVSVCLSVCLTHSLTLFCLLLSHPFYSRLISGTVDRQCYQYCVVCAYFDQKQWWLLSVCLLICLSDTGREMPITPITHRRSLCLLRQSPVPSASVPFSFTSLPVCFVSMKCIVNCSNCLFHCLF